MPGQSSPIQSTLLNTQLLASTKPEDHMDPLLLMEMSFKQGVKEERHCLFISPG